MPTEHILDLLIEERDKLNRAIEALQGPLKPRGRPAKTALASADTVASPKPVDRRRTFTAAQRKQQAERMKAYWAAKKAAANPKPKAASKPKKAAKAA
jgi:hypothetical protein